MAELEEVIIWQEAADEKIEAFNIQQFFVSLWLVKLTFVLPLSRFPLSYKYNIFFT